MLDQNITDKIARQAGTLTHKNVIEIGPGPGGLTRSLLRQGAQKLIAIEFDPRAVQALSGLQEAASGRLEIVQADALETDLTALVPAPRVIVANLPYNIATPLLVRWLEDLWQDHTAYDGMILMFQKEVAQRMTAQVNTKAYGRLSILCQWLCDVRKLFDLPPGAFTPPPKVISRVMGFVPQKLPLDKPAFATMERVTAEAFGQRRKMIRSSLKPHMAVIEALGIDSQKRAEDLTVAEFVALAQKVSF